MKKVHSVFFTILFALLSTAHTSSQAASLENPTEWRSDQFKNNALVGKIWSRKKAAFVSPKEIAANLTGKSYILLGENHDNPDHHWLQAEIINLLAQNSPKPNLVIEMIRVDQMQRLEGYRSQKNAKAKFLGTALQWEKNGWPKWDIYLPIAEQIFAHNLQIFPGHAAKQTTRHLIKSNLGILPQKAKEVYILDKPLEPELDKALINEVRQSHCNRLPENVLRPMSNIQRFRDAWMADVMLQAKQGEQGKTHPVILIAGSGHVRDDRGAPWYLKQRDPQKAEQNNIITIQFVETSSDAKSINDVAPKSPDGKLVADYIWITPSIKRGNLCDRIPDFGAKKQP